jgi:ABC-type nitrate/sulfonate/bicarbonate transport system substrate-binding protein
MLKIEDIISEDFSSYPEEAQEYLKKYTEELKEAIKDELISDYADKIIKNADKNNEAFMDMISELLKNGFKGFNKMSVRTLLNIYLEKKSEEDFIKLLEKVKVDAPQN